MQEDKPLWIFFDLLRKRSTIPLSVDQYIYFVNAYKTLTVAHFKNLNELRAFTKIFWLQDTSFETQYDDLFERTINWEQVKSTYFGKEENGSGIAGTSTEGISNGETGNAEKSNEGKSNDRTGNHETSNDETSKEKTDNELSITAPAFVEFDLIISDTKGATNSQIEQKKLSTPNFELSTQSIVPFNLRFFAQRLRRKVETSNKVITSDLDIDAMIETLSANGYIEELIYETKDSSKSRVVLLADRFGSMLGYEYLEEHLADAFQSIPDCDFEHYYFYNLPSLSKDQKHYNLLTTSGTQSSLNTENHQWTPENWFFIFSDAGAHSGEIRRKRIKDTILMCNYLRQITNQVYWINPVAPKFMGKSTSRELRRIIPMIFPIEKEWNRFFNLV